MSMRKWLIGVIACCCVSFLTTAQETPNAKTKPTNKKTKWEDGQKAKSQNNGEQKIKWANGEKVEIKIVPPDWAEAHEYTMNSHVYFPDYHAFYDPTRGYVYWEKGEWIYSLNRPNFLIPVDLNTARIQKLNDIRLSDLPERQYMIYSHQYPAQQVSTIVPVPDMR